MMAFPLLVLLAGGSTVVVLRVVMPMLPLMWAGMLACWVILLLSLMCMTLRPVTPLIVLAVVLITFGALTLTAVTFVVVGVLPAKVLMMEMMLLMSRLVFGCVGTDCLVSNPGCVLLLVVLVSSMLVTPALLMLTLTCSALLFVRTVSTRLLPDRKSAPRGTRGVRGLWTASSPCWLCAVPVHCWNVRVDDDYGSLLQYKASFSSVLT